VVCETFCKGDSIVHRLDPRGRVVVALLFSLVVAVATSLPVLGVGAALAVAGAFAARLPLLPTVKRMLTVNAFMLLLWLVLPWSSGGEALFHIGGAAFGARGALIAARTTLKANAIVLGLTVLLGTVEVARLGHALHHLRVPAKLIHLLLFTVRYIDVVHHEYARLRTAMRVRCFQPRMSRHTYRSLGYLVGMLLVHSFERSERILAAMKCRGFRGRFYVLDHFAFARRDGLFGLAAGAALTSLGILEWL